MRYAIGWYAHRLPRPILAGGVLFSHFVQVIAPFGLFAPQPIAALAGALIIAHQLLLIAAGNYAWLNWLTIVLAISAFGDAQLAAILPVTVPILEPRSLVHDVVLALVAGMTLLLSIRPTLNFFSRRQLMNFSYNPLHLVNAYGAFGGVTRKRYEIVLEGTSDAHPSTRSVWKAFEFKGKPGDPRRRPPQIAPYHLRLDWLMWFLPLSVVSDDRVFGRSIDLWFVRFIVHLLEGDRQVSSLLRHNPFTEEPPRFIRAHVYRYAYTSREERRATGAWWKRTFIAELLPPMGIGRRTEAGPEPAWSPRLGDILDDADLVFGPPTPQASEAIASPDRHPRRP